MWRSSGRGCTVMPWAPNFSQSAATLSRSGTLPPRAFRRVATLLMFTLNFVIVSKYKNLSFALYMKVEKHLLNDLKPLYQDEKVGDILDIMEELKFSHLPVVDEERLYLGMICEDDLLEVSEEAEPISKHFGC